MKTKNETQTEKITKMSLDDFRFIEFDDLVFEFLQNNKQFEDFVNEEYEGMD